MLKLRKVTKTRVFEIANDTFTSSTAAFSSLSSIAPSYASSSAVRPFFPSAAAGKEVHLNRLQATDVALKFKQWFQSGKNALLDRIFSILSDDRGADDPSSRMAADSELAELNLPLSEAFVLEVLRYGGNVLPCLKFFDWAGRQRGFHHTPATFHAIFKIMSRAKHMSLMLDFLERYMKQPYGYVAGFWNILVMGYAVAGRLEIALQLFGRMRFQGLDLDSFSYHVLLNALVEENWFDAVGVVSKQISMRGFENEFTHSIMVKNFCKQNRLEEGEEFIRSLVRDGHALSGYMVGHLVDAMCKKGKLEKAGSLVAEFQEMGVGQMEHCYAMWIKNLVRYGKVDEALEFLRSKTVSEGYVPDVLRRNMLIFRLFKENRLIEVCDLLMEMKDAEIAPDKVTMNAALCFFCKVGMVDVAVELYNSRSEFGFSPNSMAYNYLINTLCEDGSIDESYSVLRNSIDQGFFPGKRAFSILADALCREGKLEKMKELVIIALERNFMPSDLVYETFISAMCSAMRVEDGYLIHRELNRINKVAPRNTYVNLIHGFNKSNKGDVSACLMLEMQEKGHSPTPRLFRAVVKHLCDIENPEKQFFQFLELQLSRYGHSCQVYNYFINGAGHAKKPELAREAFEMMGINGVLPNLSSNVLVLQSYLKSHRASDALNFFENLSKRRNIRRRLYTTMIVGLCKANNLELALKMLTKMKENKVTPGRECYEELVLLLCSKEEYGMVVNLICELVKGERRVSTFIGNVLLLHSLRGKKLYRAWVRSLCHQDEESPHIRMLGNLIGAFSGCMTLSPPIEDLEKAIEECFPLDIYTYNMLLRKLTADQIGRARDLFFRLCRKGYEPNKWTYDTLAYGFFKHDSVAEAKILLEEMHRRGFDLF